MSQELRSGEGQKPWRPTAEFFLSNPRSAALREVCIGIVQRVEDLMDNPDVVENRDRQQILYAELEILGGKLVEMGVKPEMNTGLPLEAYQSNPVTAAEWIAGQLYPSTGHRVISEKEIIPIAQEFDETDVERVSLMKTKNMPNKMRQFIVERQVVSLIVGLLDIQEPKDPQQPLR